VGKVNGNAKGKVGEREFADLLRRHGYQARRGQQFCGGGDSPDVVSDLPYHIEVKRVEKLNLENAVAQAAEDSGGKSWIVAHRKNRGQWLVTMSADEFLTLVKKCEVNAIAATQVLPG